MHLLWLSTLVSLVWSQSNKAPSAVLELSDKFLDVKDSGHWFVEVRRQGRTRKRSHWGSKMTSPEYRAIQLLAPTPRNQTLEWTPSEIAKAESTISGTLI